MAVIHNKYALTLIILLLIWVRMELHCEGDGSVRF